MKYLKIFIIAAALLLLILLSCCFFWDDDQIVIMTWNVQNLFDDVSQGGEYPEFDPEYGQWNSNLYHLKLCSVADVITDPASGDPDIVLLQEIENSSVIETLAGVYLKGRGYDSIYVSAEEYSTVHTAILSRYPVTDIRSHRIWGQELAGQRYIMEYTIRIGKESIIIFNDHWKSKLGDNTDAEREAAAEVLFSRVLILKKDFQHIIAAGDFNSEYCEGSPFFAFRQNKANPPLVYAEPENGDGTYAYNDEWEMIDMFLVPQSLSEVFSGNVRIINPGFMLNDNGYPKSFSRISGDGYSDHLPVKAEIRLMHN